MAEKMRKIAIYGGAFDPPHNVHIDIARAAISEFGYDRILFLPSYDPPHKTTAASANQRLDMLRLALASEEKFAISVYEVDKGTVGFTVETLPKLRAIYGDFDFIIGGDSMRDLHKWYKPDKILLENAIVVAIRDSDADSARAALKAFDAKRIKSVKFMNYTPRSLSSTDIRLAVQLGENIESYVPENVAEFIANNRMYDDFALYRNKIKSTLSADRYRHTINVVKAALKLNEQCGIAYEKVFLAALLHDCAKCADVNGFVGKIPADSIGTGVAHAFMGALVAAEYGINDIDVINAIYYHTTGRADMTTLEKLIFTADMLEEERDFAGVAGLRAAAYADWESGFKLCLEHLHTFLKESGTPIYYLTQQAYEYYCVKYVNNKI